MFRTFVFTDPHCGPDIVACRTRRPSEGLSRVEQAVKAAVKAHADMIVCLGDLCNGGPRYECEGYAYETLRIIRSSGIKTLVLPGNHDLIAIPEMTFNAIAGDSLAPFSFRAGESIFVFLDACYTDDGRRYNGAADWRNSFCGGGQAERLSRLFESENPPGGFYIFSHQPFDPDCEKRHVVRNSGEILEIIKNSGRGRVRALIAGHYHPGMINHGEKYDFITLPALCEGDGTDIPERCLILDT